MKRPITLAVALVLALGLAACGGNSGTTEPTSEENTTVTTQGDDAVATQPSQTSAPDDDAVQLSAAPSNTPEEIAIPNPALAGAITVSTDKDNYSLGEDVLVTYTIQTIETFSKGIAIGIHDPLWGSHDPIYNWGASADEMRVESTEYLAAPDSAGNYEVRVYAVNGKSETGTDETLAAVIPFSVGEAAPEAPIIKTVPVVESPLESHEGDAEYFFVTSDDYKVFTDGGMQFIEQDADGHPVRDITVERYYALSYKDGLCTNQCTKDVFIDAEAAQRHAEETAVAVIGNVAYYPVLDETNTFKDAVGSFWVGSTQEDLGTFAD